jgi:uncharacterized protein YkwD
LGNDCLEIFKSTALEKHNQLRAMHGVNSLKQNSTLNRIAQSHADYLAQNKRFEHSDNDLGENIAAHFFHRVYLTKNLCKGFLTFQNTLI